MKDFFKTHKLVVIIAGIVVVGGIAAAVILLTQGKTNPGERTEPVSVIDFTGKTAEEILAWCGENHVSCSITSEFSDHIEENNFVSQSVAAGDEVAPNESVNIIFSQGLLPKEGRHEECVKEIVKYANREHLSAEGSYDYWIAEFGEETTRWGVEHANLDWATIALARAVTYYKDGTTDYNAIRDNLVTDKFTEDEVNFAMDNLDASLENTR